MFITLLFIAFMLTIFGRLIAFAFKAAWGITKVVLVLIVLPVALIALFAAGFVYIAIPILAIVGIVALVKRLSY